MPITLGHYWDFGGAYTGMGTGFAPGLSNWNVTIQYNAQVKKNGVALSGNYVAVGDNVTFEAIPFVDTDISWFGTGRSSDSPFGHWLNGATAPSATFAATDYVGRDDWSLNTGGDAGLSFVFDVYIPLSVHPPVVTYDHTGSTAGLSCDASGQNCSVTSPGTIQGHVNFGSTYGKFYYMYIPIISYWSGIYYNQVAMREGFGDCYAHWWECSGGFAGSDYVLPVDTITITFNLTAVSNNNPPAVPTLSADAPSKNVSTDFTFTAQSTDPDGDTLRYGFDFTGVAVTPGLYAPTIATLASGTPQSALYQWPLPGTYTVRVRAEDNRGGVSGWSTPVTVTVNALPPNPIINSFTINGSTGSVNLLRGDMRNIAWNVSNAVSCTASSGDIWSGNKSVPTGNDALPANVTTPHTLDCVNVLGTHTSSTIQVNVSCTPSTGTFGSCVCATETKTRTNTSALCIAVIESASCDVDEKKACRNFNWTEGSP